MSDKPFTDFVRALHASGAAPEAILAGVESLETLVGQSAPRRSPGRPPGSRMASQTGLAVRHKRRGRPPGSKNKKKAA